MSQQKPERVFSESVELVHDLRGPSDLQKTLVALEDIASSTLGCLDVVILERHRDRLVGGGLSLQQTPESPTFFRGPKLSAFQGLPPEIDNLFLVPLYSPSGTILGAVVFLQMPRSVTEAETEAATSFSTMAAMALWKARLVARRDSLKQEMQLAAEVVRELLPAAGFRSGAYRFEGLLEPAGATGGDIYDFFPTSQGKVAFLLADASGKGMATCLQVTQARAYFRALVSTMPLTDAAARINQLLREDLAPHAFVTAVLGVVDISTHRVRLVDAGHGLMLHRHRNRCFSTFQSGSNMPLGISASLEFKEFTLTLNEGELLLFYTDGWTERCLPSGEQLGQQRLNELLAVLDPARGKEALFRLHQEVDRLCGPATHLDDMTMLTIHREASSTVEES